MNQFDTRAAQWDENPGRVKMAQDAVKALDETLNLNPQTKAMELGCGTGLATLLMADKLASITAVDSSEGMLDVLRQKIDYYNTTNVTPVFADLTHDKSVTGSFDLIYSVMAFHHIKDIPPLLGYFHDLLTPGGTVAIIDLDTEDGTFHAPGTHIEHKGFDRHAFKNMLTVAGFANTTDKTALTIPRETPAGPRDFPVFLITAVKNGQ